MFSISYAYCSPSLSYIRLVTCIALYFVNAAGVGCSVFPAFVVSCVFSFVILSSGNPLLFAMLSISAHSLFFPSCVMGKVSNLFI